MSKRAILFVGCARTISRHVVPDNRMNMRIVSKRTDVEGFIEADVFWIGNYWTLSDYEQIREAVYRMKDVREFIIQV